MNKRYFLSNEVLEMLKGEILLGGDFISAAIIFHQKSSGNMLFDGGLDGIDYLKGYFIDDNLVSGFVKGKN